MRRKRNLLVDTQSLVLKVVVSSADAQNRDGEHLVVHAVRLFGPALPWLRMVCADATSAGQFAPWAAQEMG